MNCKYVNIKAGTCCEQTDTQCTCKNHDRKNAEGVSRHSSKYRLIYSNNGCNVCIYTFNVWKLNQNITTYTHKNVHYITELYFQLQMGLKFKFLLSILMSISNQLPECWSEDTAKNKLIKTMMKNLTKLKAKT
jgi:hypothetical protein